MEMTEFVNLTRKILQDYGFKKIANRYYLNLERMVISLYFMAAINNTGAKAFLCEYCFKDIHEDYRFEKNDDFKHMPTDRGSFPFWKSSEILHADNGKPYKKWAFYPQDYTEAKWTRILTEMLNKYVTPFKDNFEKQIQKVTVSISDFCICVQAYDALVAKGVIHKK